MSTRLRTTLASPNRYVPIFGLYLPASSATNWHWGYSRLGHLLPKRSGIKFDSIRACAPAKRLPTLQMVLVSHPRRPPGGCTITRTHHPEIDPTTKRKKRRYLGRYRAQLLCVRHAAA